MWPGTVQGCVRGRWKKCTSKRAKRRREREKEKTGFRPYRREKEQMPEKERFDFL